jgi:putative toxin-antitoxin system antitoxin component (TIGR02293 family)
LTNTTKCIKFVTNVVLVKKKPLKYSTKEQPVRLVKEKDLPVFAEVSYASIVTDDAHRLIDRSRNGMTMYQIENLMKRYDLTLKEMAAVLNISERTLQRYEDEDILSKDASERALHLQRLYERGADVLGTLANFCDWMKSPVLIFSNEMPITFLDTIFGFELLEQELGRIEHGIFA